MKRHITKKARWYDSNEITNIFNSISKEKIDKIATRVNFPFLTNVNTVFLKLYLPIATNYDQIQVSAQTLYKIHRLIINNRARNQNMTISGVRYIGVSQNANTYRTYLAYSTDYISASFIAFHFCKILRIYPKTIRAEFKDAKSAMWITDLSAHANAKRIRNITQQHVPVNFDIAKAIAAYFRKSETCLFDNIIEFSTSTPKFIDTVKSAKYRSIQKFGTWNKKPEIIEAKIKKLYSNKPRINKKQKAAIYYQMTKNSQSFNPYIYNRLRGYI